MLPTPPSLKVRVTRQSMGLFLQIGTKSLTHTHTHTLPCTQFHHHKRVCVCVCASRTHQKGVKFFLSRKFCIFQLLSRRSPISRSGRFTFARQRSFPAASSHLPHTLPYATSKITAPHSHSCRLLPLLFSSHPCSSLLSFPSLTFLAPSDDCGGDSCYETRRDI